MRNILMKALTFQTLAVAAFLVSFLFWLSGGANASWTVTSTTTMVLDEITEIEYPVVTEGLVPGVEFLFGGLFSMIMLLGLDVFFARKTNKA